MGRSNYSGLSGQQQRIKSEFASSRKGATQDLRGEHAELTTKRPSLMQNMASADQHHRVPAHPQDAEGLKSTRSFLGKTREEMWSEFNNHFRDPNRAALKVNHHDFLDGGFLAKLKEQQSRRTFFSQVGTQSLDRGGRAGTTPYEEFQEADIELGRNRLLRAQKNYHKMQL